MLPEKANAANGSGEKIQRPPSMLPPSLKYLAKATSAKKRQEDKAAESNNIDRLFELFDEDGDGVLNFKEMQNVFLAARGPKKPPFPDQKSFYWIAGKKPGASKQNLKKLFRIEKGYLRKMMIKIRRGQEREATNLENQSSESSSNFSSVASTFEGGPSSSSNIPTRNVSLTPSIEAPDYAEFLAARDGEKSVIEKMTAGILTNLDSVKRPAFSAAVARAIEALSVYSEGESWEETLFSGSDEDSHNSKNEIPRNIIVDEKSDYERCKYFVELFDTCGTRRLNLQDMRRLFEASGATMEEDPYPDYETYCLFADSSARRGMNSKELHAFLSQDPGYIEMLYVFLHQWEKEQRGIRTWAMCGQGIDDN
eukprot:GEMP01044559.1.p1 GENE.GEMP01044559.1~~GEMP01044559.1.p1  ORF type:complete len:367 (+),score=60.90 GEMP01044559.1:132-1232(+)